MVRIRKARHGPEWYIQRDLISFYEARQWLVERLIGNELQSGLPDLYIFRRDFGERWIDVKNPKRYSFTRAQRDKWPTWEAHGLGIWIITAADDAEYAKLFQPPNWRSYVKRPEDFIKPDLDQLLKEIE